MRGAGGEPEVLLAEAGAVGQGRFLAIGDPSIFINSMLQGDGLGIVRFDDTAQILMPVTDVGPHERRTAARFD